MPPFERRVPATRQGREHGWTTIKKRNQKNGKTKKHNADKQVASSDQVEHPKQEPIRSLKPANVVFLRGLSDTFDGLSLTKDDLSRRLLQGCKTDSDRLDAVIISGLMNPNSLELFDHATEVSCGDEFPEAIGNFAHSSGDIHTALNVVRSRLAAERKDPKSNLNKWCKENGVLPKGLKFILHYIHDFRPLWDYDDENVDNEGCDYQIIINLQDNLKMELCYYLGHPSLGYKNIHNGQIVNICSSSVLHLLISMPEYIVCHPRHLHSNSHSSRCNFLIPVYHKHAEAFIEADFPAFNKENIVKDKVSLVAEIQPLGVQSCQLFVHRWDTIKNELDQLCDNRPVVLDETVTLETNKINVFATNGVHSHVRSCINRKIRDIQTEMSDRKAEMSYPVGSQFRLVLSQGLECHKVLFPYEPTPNDSTIQTKDVTESATSQHLMFKTEIDVNLDIGDLQPLEVRPFTTYDPLLKSSAVLKRLFSDLNEKHWSISGMSREEDSHVTMGLHFLDYITATRAISLLDDAYENKIPITILNKKSIDRQMCGFEILLNRRVMTTIGKLLLAKLENYRLSDNYSAEYKVVELENMVTQIQVVAKDNKTACELLQKFKTCLAPSKKQLNQRQRDYFAANLIEGHYLFKEIHQRTNAYIHYCSHLNYVCVYGTEKAKTEAIRHLGNFMHHGHADKLNEPKWFNMGKISLEHGNLPNDFFMSFRQRYKNLCDISDCPLVNNTSDANVDMIRSEIWLKSVPSKENDDVLGNMIKECLEEHYSISPKVTFVREVDNEQPECVACFSPINGNCSTLESCGHKYCVECQKTQVITALNESKLPLCCAECDTKVSVVDLENWVYNLRICKFKQPLKLAQREFLREYREEYRPCPKTDCDGVCYFHKFLDMVTCGLCSGSVCPKCLQKYHKGMTCEEYQASYLSIEAWMKENCKSRKTCTHCKMGIEKYDGCNNVYCVYCKKNLCWVCLKVFDNSDLCYSHMDETGHWNDI